MIKKTLIAAICLFSVYTVFLQWFAPDWISASQHQWQDNTIKAERFIYSDKAAFNNVIVGSSLSSRLVMDSLPHTYNLSFGGQSLFDGLSILARSGQYCKRVFIEMNFILKKEDKSFTSSLFSLLYYPRKKLLSLRSDRQPIAIFGENIKYRIIGRTISFLKSHLVGSEPADQKIVVVPESGNDGSSLFSKLLQMQIQNYSSVPAEQQLNEAFNNLNKNITELEKRNIEVVFFEMPVNSSLQDLPLARTVRQTFYKNFPSSKYKYIPFPDSVKFVTTDGVHLTDAEALEYTTYLKQQVNNYLR